MASTSNSCPDNVSAGNIRRKTLAAAVGAILQESGFQTADKAAIGTLTEILQSSKISKIYFTKNFDVLILYLFK